MSAPQPYPTRDPWDGTDEADADEPTMGPGDYCHHGVPFDEDCDWCDDESESEMTKQLVLSALLAHAQDCPRNKPNEGMCSCWPWRDAKLEREIEALRGGRPVPSEVAPYGDGKYEIQAGYRKLAVTWTLADAEEIVAALRAVASSGLAPRRPA